MCIKNKYTETYICCNLLYSIIAIMMLLNLWFRIKKSLPLSIMKNIESLDNSMQVEYCLRFINIEYRMKLWLV